MMVHDEMPVVEFTAQDRCDGCGAQAYAAATSEFGELLLCGHHLRRNYDRLLDEGWEVTEDFEALDRLYNPQNYIEETV